VSSGGAGTHDDAALRGEARILARYLLSHECPDEVQERYARGTRTLHGALNARGELAVARFALEHPAALPFLDAAAALTGRGRLLRAKLQLMAAVLEASPRFVDEFLPRRTALWRAGLLATWIGAKSAFEAALGIPLLLALAAFG